jgi:hypothetical protein
VIGSADGASEATMARNPVHVAYSSGNFTRDRVSQSSTRVGSVPLTLGSTVLAGIGGLTGYAGGTYGQVSLAAPGSGSGTAVPAIGLDQLRGNGFLTLLAGRAPARPGEIALGQRTLHALGVHIGQQVKVGANGTTSPMRVVGTAVFADFSVGGGSATDLGTGAVVPASALSQPNPPFCGPPQTCYNFFLLKYQPHRPGNRGRE